VKVFPRDGGYYVDLVVSTDGPADAAWFAAMQRCLSGANRILYDVTDGQMCLHRVVLLGDGERFDDADVMVTTKFYEGEPLPQPWVHGVTRVSKRTTVVNGRERESLRIGDWVKLPFTSPGKDQPLPWDHPRLTRVMAHELGHYLIGALDEYDTRTGRSWCRCLMGDRRTTELCREGTHTDTRREESCWSLAKTLYPALRTPAVEDPGPWDPPAPVFVLPR
jgi:hypothetical protein